MKRLLGLLLAMGIVGCGGSVDRSKLVERGGLIYERNSETPFTGVAVAKYANGKKKSEATVKDGKHCVALAVLNEFLKAKRVKELSHADG